MPRAQNNGKGEPRLILSHFLISCLSELISTIGLAVAVPLEFFAGIGFGPAKTDISDAVIGIYFASFKARSLKLQGLRLSC